MTALLKDRVGAYVSDHPGRTAYEIALALRARRKSVDEVLADPTFKSDPGPHGARVFTFSGALGQARTAKGALTHKQRVLNLLADGKPHTHHELYALYVVAHSRISDLRADGYQIAQWREGDDYVYQLTGGLLGAGSGVAHSPLPAPSGLQKGHELEPGLSPTAAGRSTDEGDCAASGAGDVAAQPDGQLTFAAPEFRKSQVAA